MAKNNIVSWDVITNFVVDAFKGYGIPEEDAKICADVLLESDKRGIESHGVNRFKPIYLDRIKAGIQFPVTNFEIIKETPTTAVVDGHHGMGQVIGYKSMEWLSRRPRNTAWAWSPWRQFHPLWYCWLLCGYGRQRGLHRHDRHQRPSLRRAYLWR